VVVIC